MRMGSARDGSPTGQVDLRVCRAVGAEGVRAGPFAHPTLSGRCTSRRPASRAGEGVGWGGPDNAGASPALCSRHLVSPRAAGPVRVWGSRGLLASHKARAEVSPGPAPHPRSGAGDVQRDRTPAVGAHRVVPLTTGACHAAEVDPWRTQAPYAIHPKWQGPRFPPALRRTPEAVRVDPSAQFAPLVLEPDLRPVICQAAVAAHINSPPNIIAIGTHAVRRPSR